MSLDEINYEGKRLDDKEFKIKFKTGEDIYNAKNNAIGGELFLSTGVRGGLYFATQTSDKGNDFIYKAGDLSVENKLLGPVLTYKITNSGGDFNLRSSTAVRYHVDWGDGTTELSTTDVLAHTYTAGSYTIKITAPEVYTPDFVNSVTNQLNTSDVLQITSVQINDRVNLGTSLGSSWRGASNMTDFTASSATSSVTNFYETWRNCSGLTSFPLIDTSAGTQFGNCWYYCSGLTSFPQIDTSSGTDFTYTWQGTGLTSFPSLDFSSATTFNNSWRAATSLSDFPANMFDTTGTLISSAFTDAWKFCALTAQSIENILVSLDANGTSNITLGIDGGTNAAYSTWSSAAQTALSNLQTKGWTVSYNS
jgi:hypothetical protein